MKKKIVQFFFVTENAVIKNHPFLNNLQKICHVFQYHITIILLHNLSE